MTSSVNRSGEQVKSVRISEESLVVDLTDGRSITAPLAWYPRLSKASRADLENWQISAGGYGIHWPDLDEDVSTEGLLRGAPAPRGSVPAES